MSSQSNPLDLSLSLCLHPSSSNATAACTNGANVLLPASPSPTQTVALTGADVSVDSTHIQPATSLSTVALSGASSDHTHGQPTHAQNNCNSRRAHKVMSQEEREHCIDTLLLKQTDLKLPKGTINQVSLQFGVSRWTIWRLWNTIKRLIVQKKRIIITCNFKGRVGRKRIQLDYDQLMNVPLKKRTTIRALAAAIKINKSTVHRFIKWGQIKRHSNAMKPGLTPINKLQRLRWCIQSVIPRTINTIPKFQHMYNIIHVDEKWFFMSQATQNFYLAPNELQPYRTCKHKSHINKVMFIVAVGRPRFNDEGGEIFNGKIGVFPLTTKEAAKRNSKNRNAGTIETKPIKKITKNVMKKKFIEEIIPSIKAKWPIDACGTIWIQLDNATPHMGMTDDTFKEAANSDGFHIHLLPQPPNSPDLNVLDLGFFRAIQSIQHQVAPRTVDELVSAVKYAFDVFDSKLLNHVFISYQYVMLEVMKVRGGNNYTLPHYGKGKMERQGTLPETVEVPQELLLECASDLRKQFVALQEAENMTETNADDDDIMDDENILDAHIHGDEEDIVPEYYTIPEHATEAEDNQLQPEEHHQLHMATEGDGMQTQSDWYARANNIVQELDLLKNFT